ncbi:hypothetical protein [Curtobacterium sp. MCPF17_052]|uniref:hypothetical protein n=1 Tax=Curtobacterium sp. MCPF17_052 TaxID=2175655 RepID=UPI0024DF5F77|nr:hypothetical protein [Curtobacterium sp. MCPF17_052]WIB11863.1 hypothetical protein DEJ36_13395 [Curtobacterium sp. MCPF17_052]
MHVRTVASAAGIQANAERSIVSSGTAARGDVVGQEERPRRPERPRSDDSVDRDRRAESGEFLLETADVLSPVVEREVPEQRRPARERDDRHVVDPGDLRAAAKNPARRTRRGRDDAGPARHHRSGRTGVERELHLVLVGVRPLGDRHGLDRRRRPQCRGWVGRERHDRTDRGGGRDEQAAEADE